MTEVMIGIDPHKSWHTAVAIGAAEEPPGELPIHMAAITQIRYRHSDGRACDEKKIAGGKTHKEALRSLKHRISDAIYAALLADARQEAAAAARDRPSRTAGPWERTGALVPAHRLPGLDPARRTGAWPVPDPRYARGTPSGTAQGARPAISPRPTAAAQAGPAPRGPVPPSCQRAPRAMRPADHLRRQISDQGHSLFRRAQSRTPPPPAGH